MKKMTLIATTIAMAAASHMAMAEDTPEKDWTASAELGFLYTDGNSESETLNAKFAGTKNYKKWQHELKLEALNSSSNDQRSSEKYLAGLQSDYAVDERSYVFSALNWEKDRFSSYDYQASWAIGYGYKVIAKPDHKLRLEAAPGFRVSEPVTGGKQEEAIVRLAEKYSLKLSDTSNLNQSLSYEWGDENAVTKFNISVSSQVAGDLSMKVGFGLKHNSDVAEGAEKTDKETSVTLVYDF